MKIKKIILIVFFLLFLTGCQVKKSNPLFFEVQKEGSTNKIYLLGSIHTADKTLYPLPDKIIDSYKNSTILAAEFDIIKYTQNIGAQISIMQQFMYTDGTIKDVLDEQTYQKMEDILKKANIYSSLYNAYKPIIWNSLVENAAAIDNNLSEEYGVDMYMLNLAHEDNKSILELESADYQYNVLLSFSDDLSLYLLKDAVSNYELSKAALKELYEAYKEGDRETLEKLIFTEEEVAPEEQEMIDEYNKALIDDRNKEMFKNLDKAFQEGETIFCTVGLAHIIGENGLVNYFKQNGYTVIEI